MAQKRRHHVIVEALTPIIERQNDSLGGQRRLALPVIQDLVQRNHRDVLGVQDLQLLLKLLDGNVILVVCAALAHRVPKEDRHWFDRTAAGGEQNPAKAYDSKRLLPPVNSRAARSGPVYTS